jgi:glycosyltransferase involved in cell wall biosynthesis
VLSSLRRLAGRSSHAGDAASAPRVELGGGLPDGVNVIGYLDRTSGLAERARVLIDVLGSAGVPCSRWPVGATASPVETAGASALDVGPPVLRRTTIAVATASELPGLLAAHAGPLRGVDRVIGYWFWEVEAIPESHRAAIDAIDEIWTPTVFVRDAYRAVTDKPVHLVPLPIARPDVAPLGRADVGLDDRFTFLVSFDHLSVMERKHPLGAIEAFVRAFPRGDEPVRLLIKTLNGAVRPMRHGTLLRAAARDPRIDVVDAHTTADRHMALIAHADAYVSLHRSEGLGLQPAAAMWLGTPVIASRYSGTLDLMDDESAELIDVELIPVRNTDGAYPPEACWADPDLDQAAAAMRRLIDDGERRGAVVAAALARRVADADVDAAGALVVGLLASGVSHGHAPVGSVAPMSDQPPAAPAPAPAARSEVKRVARAATAPVRNYINHHFEMVKDEVRTQAGDRVHLANLIHELEASVTETSLHQARTIARLREESVVLSERIGELERMIERLTEVVAAATLQRVDDLP